jgi:RimJ/RimL family protein N-acetyltransferase
MCLIPFMLADGRTVTIRPMTAGDLPSLAAMHDRLSKQSLYDRYFTAQKPSLAALREQLQPAWERGAALAAALDAAPRDIIGAAYYVITPGDRSVAEPAFLVEDRFQGQGLGYALFDGLLQDARAQALQGFQLYVLPHNQRMLHLLCRQPFPLERHYRDGMLEARLRLDLQPAQAAS